MDFASIYLDRVFVQFITEQSVLIPERNGVVPERNGLLVQRNALFLERNWLIPEQNALISVQNGLVPEAVASLKDKLSEAREVIKLELPQTGWKEFDITDVR